MTKPSDGDTCFYCAASPTFFRRIRMAHPADPSWLDTVTGKVDPPFGGIYLAAYTCDAHDDGLCEAMLDHFGIAPGERLNLDPSNCPDPFHTGGSEGDRVEISTTGSVHAHGFKCPTCGFQTVTTTPSVHPSDPVYRYARDVLDAFLGDPVPTA